MEQGAARGLASAIKLLQGPECPEPLEYLLNWAQQLARARTVGMHGVNGFTYEGIAAWSAFSGHHPSPIEVEALFAIDAVMRFPEAIPEGEGDG